LIVSYRSSHQTSNAKSPDVPGGVDIASAAPDVSRSDE
jgi:hypothetical protein